MGVWGYAPFESDDFGDMHDEVRGAIAATLVRKIEAQLKRVRNEDAAEKWAAIGLVIRAYDSTYVYAEQLEDAIETAIDYFHELEDDKEWQGRWRGKDWRKMFVHVGSDLQAIHEMARGARGVRRPAASDIYEDLEHHPRRNPMDEIEEDLGTNPRVSFRIGERVSTSHGTGMIHRIYESKNVAGELLADILDESDGELIKHIPLTSVTRLGADHNPHRWPKSEVQSLLFEKSHFTAAQAKAWAKEHGYLYGDVDTTGSYHRLRQEAPHGGPCRTVEFGHGVKAIVCAAGRGRPPGVPHGR